MPATSEYAYHDATATCTEGYLVPRLLALLNDLHEDATIVDLGCGNGSLTVNLLRKRWTVAGVDASSSGVAKAKQAHPAISFHVGDVTENLTPLLGADAFDAVVATEVIEHLYSPRPFVRNCYALLKPGGRVLISTPYHGYLKNVSLALTGKLDRHFTALWDGGHIKFWSRHTLTALLLEAGFTDVSFHGAGRLPYLWKSMILTATKPVQRPF